MRPEVAVVAGYGLFTLAGGAVGFVKAKSLASLVAGSLAGTSLLACAAGMRQGSLAAALGSLLVALLLGVRFAATWRRRHRLMPDLLMVLFSAVTVIAVSVPLLGAWSR